MAITQRISKTQRSTNYRQESDLFSEDLAKPSKTRHLPDPKSLTILLAVRKACRQETPRPMSPAKDLAVQEMPGNRDDGSTRGVQLRQTFKKAYTG